MWPSQDQAMWPSRVAYPGIGFPPVNYGYMGYDMVLGKSLLHQHLLQKQFKCMAPPKDTTFILTEDNGTLAKTKTPLLSKLYDSE